ncbi:MAG: DUF882 domain-containing protein [Hyphomicrobiales bacterium]
MLARIANALVLRKRDLSGSRPTHSSLPKKVTAVATAIMMMLSMIVPAQAAEERRLKFYFTHTKERIDIVYKRNGRYVPKALKKINHFLRDWRQNQSTKMDPRLLDLIWSVYQQMDTREAIHVISAYRAPKTNNMLRRRGRGVAKNSQHTRGKALDFFIPGVNLAKLRATGLKMEVGGVGYYPTSGSPFVHMDTGSVRHWPRMTQKQLAKVFPRGDTTQVPSNGKRQKRYKESLARQKRIAANEISPPNSRRGGGVFARVFNRDQKPATIPTTGQSLSSGNGNVTIAAPPIDVIPRSKPSGVPTELLAEEDVQVAQENAPAPRPMPAELVALRNTNDSVLPAKQDPSVQSNTTQTTAASVMAEPAQEIPAEASERAVASAWSQVGDNHSTDVSKLVSAKVGDGSNQGAPDVAKAVMTALNSTRGQTGAEPKDTEAAFDGRAPSAAASIAAAILSPKPGTDTKDRESLNDSLVSAYAPTAPTPNTRPAFNAALGFGNASDTTAVSEIEKNELPDDLTPAADTVVASPRIPAVAPRSKPAPRVLASLPEQPKQEAPLENNTAREELPERIQRRASLSGRVPSSAVLKRNTDLKFRGGEQAVLASMTTPDTTRSVTFAKFEMPNPYRMQNVFVVPTSVVDNSFEIGSTTLRTDKFFGKAIVATKLARLAQR